MNITRERDSECELAAHKFRAVCLMNPDQRTYNQDPTYFSHALLP